jgi:opacity protein-like surface antigen
VSGCTTPAQPNTEIAIELEGPSGETSVVFVTTDSSGCFNKTVTFPHEGNWNVRTYFSGSKCKAPSESDPTSVSVPPSQGGGGNLPPGSKGLLWYSFHLGHNFPLGSFRRTYNSGPSLTADLEYQFRDNLSLYGMLGYHYFNGQTSAVRDLSYTNLSLDIRGYFPLSTWRGYVQAGSGVYFPNFGPSKFGMNFGGGLNFNIQPKLVLELGTDLHYVDPGGSRRLFVDPKLGIKFRF